MASVHVRYTVGTRVEEIKNVNIKTLMEELTKLEKKEGADRISKVLGVKADTPNAWIDALVISPPKLHVTDDTCTRTSFIDKWWVAKTPAHTVICLLDASIAVEKKKEQADLDNQVRQNLRAAAAAQGNVLNPSLTTNITDAQVQAWLASHA